MAYLEFQDSAGLTWRVWDTYPSRPEVIDTAWRDGWLTFECGAVRRRLTPIPNGWAEAEPPRLELMCKVAEPSRPETSPADEESAQPPPPPA
jgi:hypothetical protein